MTLHRSQDDRRQFGHLLSSASELEEENKNPTTIRATAAVKKSPNSLVTNSEEDESDSSDSNAGPKRWTDYFIPGEVDCIFLEDERTRE